MRPIPAALLLLIGSLFSQYVVAQCSELRLSYELDHDALWRDFTTLAADDMQGRQTDTPGSLLAQSYLTGQYRDIGLLSFQDLEGYLQPFNGKPFRKSFEAANIVGWLKGDTHPQRYIVITAHYDHLGKKGSKIYNGADDNASGVAVMLALARHIEENGSRYSVVFLATDAEEKGLLGARAFMHKPPIAIDHMAMNLNLDMLSQNRHRSRLYVYGGMHFPELKPLVAILREQAGLCVKPGRNFTLRRMSSGKRINWRMASDHGIFGKHDIPYFFLGVSEHRFYHTEDDIVENVEKDFYLTVAETSLKLFRLMDARPAAVLGQEAP